ncbi:GNAT family N-acetyltransferase [Fictibacillus nanhaiensis]|uniref:GNAT family N-acetyltransferase n=1 Tax=Fictibacillus nanhaiensis TaxID=742169 RepID=UPI001C968B07|nr:GNAT family N-acetyltransferase [Fictibacillus nanhaiensis]MBY6036909.1 GNAT family N-acetyltransferase [Fictibacillus nanhaiensis]
MLKKLSFDDKDNLYNLLKQKPSENLFILWGIEAFGFNSDLQSVWGDYNESNELRGILYKYKDKYAPFGIGDFDIEGFVSIISKDTNANILVGIESITEKVKPYLFNPVKNSRSYLYAELKSTHSINLKKNTEVSLATETDVNKIVELYKKVPEFEGDNHNPDVIAQNITKGWSRNYVIENGGEYVSSASTVCENSLSAMISAVCTLTSYKKKRYATKCLENLIHDLQIEGKTLCLFYDNAEAGRIYKRLGFKDIEKWSVSTL